ncbi:MAG: peptidoglycan/xylan/chitin deacetylase (PgdA/CDA1 family) [Pseudohongiellaceae bacterium]|jgi:peptidoglycan/xylan/chitin deacetylase (PgdA/CDA1 family)
MKTPAAVPILTYHSLDTSGSVLSVAPDEFAEHMASLASRGYTGVRLDALLDAWAGRGTLPERPVVLTFDDGFRNLLECGAPVLTDLGFSATVFAVSGRCGADNAWPGQDPTIPVLPLMTWDELAELANAGFEVGSHTTSHARLDQLSDAEARNELNDSKRAIEDRLSLPVRTFAYPCGSFRPGVVEAVGELYEGACSVRLGTARASGDLRLLPRLDVYYLRSLPVFRLLGTRRGAAYLALRGLGRTVRGLLVRD